jgi:hypothetical protein
MPTPQRRDRKRLPPHIWPRGSWRRGSAHSGDLIAGTDDRVMRERDASERRPIAGKEARKPRRLNSSPDQGVLHRKSRAGARSSSGNAGCFSHKRNGECRPGTAARGRTRQARFSCGGIGKVTVMTDAMKQPANLLALALGLGLAFQVGHFAEHAVQFLVWATGNYPWVAQNFCGRAVPYMSPPATAFVHWLGTHLFPNDPPARQMMVGMEVLHLIGNAMFLSTIAGVLYLFPVKLARYALYIEGAHMCEHIALTLSAYFLDKPIGLSTAFGHAVSWWGIEAAVGYRVTFHVVMNLLPMPFVMMALMQQWSASRADTGLTDASGQRMAGEAVA